MYRIHFDPKIGRFIIQVMVLGCFWAPVKKLADTNDKVDRLTFNKFSEAVDHVEAIGLDKLYADKSANKYRSHIGKGYERMTDANGAVIQERFYTGS